MTPIKVRGKKQPAASMPDVNPSSSRQPKGKRCLSPTSTCPARKWYRAVGSRRLIAKGEDRLLSSLEKLPIEILESIFFDCLNLNLPQASITLCHKLTSDHVKSLLVWKVFGSANPTGESYDLATVLPTVQEQAEVQTAILQAKWMTRAFLDTLVPKYVIKTLVRELGARGMKWMGSGPVVSKELEPIIQKYIEDNMWRKKCLIFDGLPAYWELQRPTGIKDESVCVGVGLYDGLVTIWDPYDAEYYQAVCPMTHYKLPYPPWSKWRLISCVDDCRIPEKLLRGPWDDNKVEFLGIVIRGNASVDWVGTTSGEVAKQGLLQALRQRKFQAVEAMLERNERNAEDSFATIIFNDEDALYASYDNDESECDDDYTVSAYVDHPVRKGVGIPVTNEHMRVAILEMKCETSVINPLLNHIPDGRYVLDDEIHEWVVINASKRNKHALFLQHHETYQRQLELK